MLVYARRELGLVALILFACNSSQTAPALDAVWMPEVAAVRNATFDALGSRERLDRDFRQWLSRPEICSVSNATLRLEIRGHVLVAGHLPAARARRLGLRAPA